MTIRVKNWNKFQHYKHRRPPWIRLYHDLLEDPEWFALDGDASKMLANCWLLAAESSGALPSIKKICFRLRTNENEVAKQIAKLSHWLEYDASDLLAPCKQLATTETDNTETDNTETETDNSEARASAKPRRGTRLDAEWWPTEGNVEYAIAKGLSLDRVNVEAEKFRNHWTSKAGKDAAKLNWSATWQNWILNAMEIRNGATAPRETLVDRGKRLAERARELERAAGVGRPDDPFGGH